MAMYELGESSSLISRILLIHQRSRNWPLASFIMYSLIGKSSNSLFVRSEISISHSMCLNILCHSLMLIFFSSAICALERSYLLKENGKVVERPQYMFMRVACAIHGDDLPRILETYELLSTNKIMHASPTLRHAGTTNRQLTSCFLFGLRANPTNSESLLDCVKVNNGVCGIGISVTNYPAAGYVQ